jgi:hypothetical protein
MQKWLEGIAQDVANKVSSQLKTVVDINHLPPDESPEPASRLRSLSPAARGSHGAQGPLNEAVSDPFLLQPDTDPE